jgi:hypothetical protein
MWQRPEMRVWIILAVLLLPASTHSQTLQLTGGGGTLFDNGMTAEGVEGKLYLPASTISGGIAYENGKIVPGASDETIWRGWDTVIGTSFLSMSAQDASVSVALAGVSLRRKSRDKKTSITIFAGATGTGFQSPFSAAVLPSHVGIGVLLSRSFKNATLSSLAVINNNQKTLAEGLEYHYRRTVKLTGTVGLLNNQKFFEGTALVQPITQLNLSANHVEYFAPYQATGNSIGASFSLGRFNANANLNESISLGREVTGRSFSGGVRIGIFQERESYYTSNGRSIFTHSGIETWRHWTATETLSQSQGQNSLQFGGGYAGNKYSVSLNHGIQFLLSGQGYQQVTQISVSVRIRDTVISGNTVTSPYGKTLYDVYASSYKQTGLQVAGPGGVTYASSGRYKVSGTCKTAEQEPIAGCAILLGKILVFSDTQGHFDAGQKKNQAVSVTVEIKEFSAPGNTWRVVSAPVSASPGQTIEIVVARW